MDGRVLLPSDLVENVVGLAEGRRQPVQGRVGAHTHEPVLVLGVDDHVVVASTVRVIRLVSSLMSGVVIEHGLAAVFAHLLPAAALKLRVTGALAKQRVHRILEQGGRELVGCGTVVVVGVRYYTAIGAEGTFLSDVGARVRGLAKGRGPC